MRLPASYAGVRRAPGRPAVLTAPFAKAQVHKPQVEGLRRRQRVAISIGANADSSSDGGLSSDDSLSSGNESDGDSDADGANTGSVRVDASANLAASSGRIPLRVGTPRASRSSKRSVPKLSKAEIERRCNCKQHAHAQPAANAAVDATILVKIEDGDKDGEEGDDEEEDEEDEDDDEEEEDDEEEDDDDSSSSSSDSSDEDEEDEEEDDKKDENKDVIVPILPAAAARIKRRALQGRRTRRLRNPSPRAANVASSDDDGVSSASDGESPQSSDDGVSSSDDEGALPDAPAVSASAGVKVSLPDGKIGVVGTVNFEASTSNILPRSTHSEVHSQSSRIADMTSFSRGASPCAIVTTGSVFLVAVLALFAFRLRRRRSSSYVAVPSKAEVIEDLETGKAHPRVLEQSVVQVSTWFTPNSSDIPAVPAKD